MWTRPRYHPRYNDDDSDDDDDDDDDDDMDDHNDRISVIDYYGDGDVTIIIERIQEKSRTFEQLIAEGKYIII